MSFLRFRRGSPFVIVIVFAAVLSIFLMMIGRLRQGYLTLMSKSGRDFLATTVGETGLNCIFAEFRIDNDYHTHDLYKPISDPPWVKPIKKRESSIKSIGADLYVSGVKEGVYGGGTQFGQFKAHIAKILGKNLKKTKTLRESQMFVRVEVMAHVGDEKHPEDDSYRRVSALVEKRSPISEYLLYDGEMLDIALGPYEKSKNVFSTGRLYGYQWITFSALNGKDEGSQLSEMEKIETPGMIQAFKDTPVKFANNNEITVTKYNDSTNYLKFNPYDGFIVDGSHGGHSIKLTHLPKEDILAKAKKKNGGGLIIETATFKKSAWKNPYDTGTDYYDIDFGEFRVGQTDSDTPPPDDGDPGDEDNPIPPPTGSDDPPEIKAVKGEKLLLYSKVPLRVWGCPDRTTTIFCEKDLVIGGDFNQNPEKAQDYPDSKFQNYKSFYPKAPINGKGNYKIGALLMSMERILIDVSRPTLFLKNEAKPFFMTCLAKALWPVSTAIEDETRENLCPMDPSKRQGIFGLNTSGGARFTVIFSLYKDLPTAPDGDPNYENKVIDIKGFFTPKSDGKPHFGIKDSAFRKKITWEIVHSFRDDGNLSRDELDRIFEMAWKQAIKEEAEGPSASMGPMGLINPLFDEAQKNFDSSPKKLGIFSPEITINASLVSTTRRSATWKAANGNQKVFDEIGNAPANTDNILEYLKPPRFIIERVYGSEIRIATGEPKYFISGNFSGTAFLRRRIWDPSLTGGAYQPKALPFVFNLLTFREDTATKKEFDNF
ncbi:hypothetical protein HYY75_06735 [bacterium]|nr:hypothetical protein [bacterium]